MFIGAGVQRAAEDAGGAAAARGVHLRDDRGAQDPHHDPVALPALRLQADPDRPAGRAPDAILRAREDRRSSPRRLRLLARQAAGSVRDALSLLDQMIAYVGDERHHRRAGGRGAGRRRPPPAGRGCAEAVLDARRRRRRCACWPRPSTGASIWRSSARVVPGLPARPRGRGPGRAGAARRSGRRHRRGDRRGARAGGPRAAGLLPARCSIAGRARSTRRAVADAPPDPRDGAGRSVLRRAAGAAGRSAGAARRAGGAAAGRGARPARRARPPGRPRAPAPAARPGGRPGRRPPPAAAQPRRRPGRPPPAAAGRPAPAPPSPAAAARARPRPAPARGGRLGPEELWRRLRLRFEERPALAAALDHAAVESWDAGPGDPGRSPTSCTLDQTEKAPRG